MTLKRLIDTIGTIAINDRLVNFSAAGPSVYEINDLTIKNYPVIFVTPTGTQDIYDNYTTYEFAIFYIDRLLEGNYNAIDVQSTAVEALKNILKKVENTDGVAEVSDYNITIFIEQERFKDRCTGAYANVRISVVNDSLCVDEQKENWSEPGTKHSIKITYPSQNQVFQNGTRYIPVIWQTTEPSVNYFIYGEGGDYSFEVTGDTSDRGYVLTNLDNPYDVPIVYHAQLYADNVGWVDISFSLLPEYILNINPVYTLPYDARRVNINWTTNLQEVKWKLTCDGSFASSGITVGDNVYVDITQNLTDKFREYTFTAGNVAGGFERSINFIQETVVYTFAADDKTMNVDDSAVTATFTTDAPNLTFKFHKSMGGVWEENPYAETNWYSYMPKQLTIQRPGWYNGIESYDIFVLVYCGERQLGQIYTKVYQHTFEFTSEDYQTYANSESAFYIYFDTTYSASTLTFEGKNCTIRRIYSDHIAAGIGWSVEPVYAEVSVYNPEGNTLGTIHWTREGVESYFNITTPSGQTVSASSTAYTFNYETNLEPPFPYTYTSPFGTSTGNSWGSSSLTINFRVNDSENVRERTVTIGGETINWYQEPCYLNITSAPDNITNERQLVCFGWETNCNGKSKYELSSGTTSGGTWDFIRSGATPSLTGDCVTFSANTGDILYYKMDVSASFANNPNTYVVSDSVVFTQSSGQTYPYDPLRQILDNPSGNQVFYRSSDGQALPYGVMAGRALDMDNNEMWATSNVYDSNLGYGIVTFPRDIRTTNAVVENKGKLVEVVWPEGMLSINNFDVNTEGNPSIQSITLPSTLRTINALAFYNESIPYINLPIGLRKVGTLNALQRNSFYGNVDNLQILYAGTTAQWNNLAKANDWLYQKRSGQVVHCTDGDVQV